MAIVREFVQPAPGQANGNSKSGEPDLGRFIEALWEAGGSDLMLTAGSPPLIRVDKALRPIPGERVLTPRDTEKLVHSALTEEQIAGLVNRQEVDFSFNWANRARLRGNAFLQRDSHALSLRILPLRIPSLTELGVPAVIESVLARPSGLILVTGPTGGGKSTTLAAMIDYINDRRPCHILTIEDPIEYLHQHKQSAVNQREVGNDTDSFARALKAALREDPDVVLAGEMRDLESIATTLTIAETGHLVLATLHTNDTAQAIDRIIDVFPASQQGQIRLQVAASLNCVIYQRLLPKIGGGVVAAYEVLMANPAVRNLIREAKTGQLRNVISTSSKEGMQTIEDSLNELVRAGYISYEEAVTHSLYPLNIERPEDKH